VVNSGKGSPDGSRALDATRRAHRALCCERIVAAVVFLLLAPESHGPAAASSESLESSQSCRFGLKSEDPQAVTSRGLITVDGKDRVIERGKTPFEFECEAGSTACRATPQNRAKATPSLTH
jgi:hypothetical protein